MRALALVASLLFPLAASAETSMLRDPVAASMLEPTSEGRPLVERALALTNAVLGGRARYRLAGSWQSLPPPRDGVTAITVHLVAPVRSGRDFGLVVPFPCDCIFVQPAAFLSKLSTYSDASPQMLKVDEANALAFMLLHEVGHIDHGDAGNFDDPRKDHSFNFERSDQKDMETAADRYATDRLIAAAADKKDFEGWMAAMGTEMSLTKMSWNLASIRLLDNFGSSTLCSRFVFADDGLTHPNYELRILTANDLIVHTAETAELLSSFERCRKDVSPIIYERR